MCAPGGPRAPPHDCFGTILGQFLVDFWSKWGIEKEIGKKGRKGEREKGRERHNKTATNNRKTHQANKTARRQERTARQQESKKQDSKTATLQQSSNTANNPASKHFGPAECAKRLNLT